MSVEKETVRDLIARMSTLGSILKMMEGGSVGDPELEEAERTRGGEPIGQRLVAMRVISTEQLDRALRVQERLRKAKCPEEVMDILEEVHAQAKRIRLESFEEIPPTDPAAWKEVH